MEIENPITNPEAREKELHWLFRFSIVAKSIATAGQLIGGIALFFVTSATLNKWFLFFAQDELIEDPNDKILKYIQTSIEHFGGTARSFAILYLLSHGVIKLFLLGGLWRGKLWTYPTSIAIFAGFGVYQVYRYTSTHSPFLLLLTVVDIIFIALTAHEYIELRRRAAPQNPILPA